MKKVNKHIVETTRTCRHAIYIMFCTALLLATSPLVHAQETDEWKTALKDGLNSEFEVEYLHLVGYFPDGVFVEMFFAHDSIDWFGRLNYPNNGLNFKLEGINDGKLLTFNEYTSENRESGYWQIEKRMNRYFAKWSNLELSMDFELELSDAFWNPDFIKDYHKLLNSYEGVLGGQEVQLEIISDHNGPISMEWYDKASTFRLVSDWNCKDHFCRYFSIASKKLHPMPDSLYVRVVKDALYISDKFSEKDEPIAVFSKAHSRFTQIHSIIDQNYKLVVEFPYFQEGRIRKLVEQNYMGIFNDLKDSLELNMVGAGEMENRWQNFANAWFKIDFWDNYLLSGRWIIQNSWDDTRKSIPINYALKNDKMIELKDQFKTDFDLDFYLLHFIQNSIVEMPEYKNPLLRNKLNQADFKNTTFCKAGLLLSTDFDTTIGSLQLLVPYSEIKQYLKKRSEINKWLQSRING
jgi:hypothetical protein